MENLKFLFDSEFPFFVICALNILGYSTIGSFKALEESEKFNRFLERVRLQIFSMSLFEIDSPYYEAGQAAKEFLATHQFLKEQTCLKPGWIDQFERIRKLALNEKSQPKFSQEEIDDICYQWKLDLISVSDDYICSKMRQEHGLGEYCIVDFNQETGRIEALCHCCFEAIPIDSGSHSFTKDLREFKKHLLRHLKRSETITCSKILRQRLL